MSNTPSLAQQLHYEREGALCGLQGKTRADCQYPEGTWMWHHWVYGCENAAGELATMKRGIVEFYSMDDWAKPLFTLPVAEAIRTGQWKPQWATLEMIK